MSAAVTRFNDLADSLGYSEGDGLIRTAEGAQHSTQRRILIDASKHLPYLHAIYFAGPRPLVYFAVADHLSEQERATLHRQAWNAGRAPLLICITRSHIYVYNTTALPAGKPSVVDDDDQRLVACLRETTEFLEHLRELRRPSLESGSIWQSHLGKKFHAGTKCGKTLLSNLRATRRRLVESGLDPQIAHRLLLRSILILYLEQRGILNEGYYRSIAKGKRSFIEFLDRRSNAWPLFDSLAVSFNGDLFPVKDDERSAITDGQLALLGAFLSGNADLESGQLWLWPLYDFSVIPIDLVSSIYEDFLRHPDAEESASLSEYYTPPFLAEMVLDEVLPYPDGLTPLPYNVRILDPACGSGVFLVEAFRRLIMRWQAANPQASISLATLSHLLEGNIYGIDTNADALRVAAFSLYLCLLSFVDTPRPLSGLRLPKLNMGDPVEKSNLACTTAFDQKAYANQLTFDLVVGNPPWRRNWLPEGADAFLRERSLPHAKEGAHPFMWLAAVRAPTGRCALICPSKWLFNREGPDEKFRRTFFARTEVEAVINLSAIRRGTSIFHKRANQKGLFAKAIGPASVVIFRGSRGPNPLPNILYCTPKPAVSTDPSEGIEIQAPDFAWLPRQEAERRDDLWKPMMWGSWRDVALIRRLQNLDGGSLGSFVKERDWKVARGYQVGGDKRDPELSRLPFIDARTLSHVRLDALALIDDPGRSPKDFSRIGPKAIYKGPHVVFRRGKSNGRFGATYIPLECGFNDTMVGIAGPRRDDAILRALTAYLNSKVVNYFLFMTVGEWGVERDRIPKSDVMQVPAAPLRTPHVVEALAELVTRWDADEASRPAFQRRIDELVDAALDLSPHERLLVEDCAERFTTWDEPRPKHIGSAASPATRDDLKNYAAAFLSALQPLLRHAEFSLTETIYAPSRGDNLATTPLAVVTFRRTTKMEQASQVVRGSRELWEIIERLDAVLRERRSGSVYVVRHLRFYDHDQIYIVKPNLRQAWRRSIALHDADSVLAEMLGGEQS